MEYTDERNIKCPYCDWEWRDSWEFDCDDGEDSQITCGSCKREFNVTKNVTVTYSTSRIACELEKHNYKLESHFESKHDYVNGERMTKPGREWKWFRIEVCELCDKKEYVEITKDQYDKEIEGVISVVKSINR